MISKLDFVDNLKSMGCVFYLPLNDNTDISMTDQISGNKLILSNNSYFDDDIGMYRFKSAFTTSSLNVSHINVDWNSTTFPSNQYTVIANFRVVERINGKYVFSTCLYTGSVLQAFALITEKGTAHTIDLPIKKTPMGAIISANKRTYICGNKQGTFSAHTPYLPSSWINNYDGKLYFGIISESRNANVEYYLSDLMIFNRELSQSEIDEIFNDITINNIPKLKR
jgi:hypothetical protein